MRSPPRRPRPRRRSPRRTAAASIRCCSRRSNRSPWSPSRRRTRSRRRRSRSAGCSTSTRACRRTRTSRARRATTSTQYGVDNEPTSTGHKGQHGKRNAPTVYNAALHFRQFWDGRAPDVEEQAKGPMMNPVEMAMPTEKRIVETLSSMPGYVDAFKKAFPTRQGPRDPRQRGEGHRRVRAQARHAVALGQVPEGQNGSAQRRGDRRPPQVRRGRLPDVPLRARDGRRHVPEVRPRDAVAEREGPRALRGHEAGRRPHVLQGAEPAQRREDGAVLPRRLGRRRSTRRSS